jgi:xanthine/CO dehydrogenase XdhC/CoxF family maturation factor
MPLFRREREAERALLLATVAQTSGPTYTKPGAVMLIAENGEYAGLLSGGCLEGDLAEHGREVLQRGAPRLLHYDTHGPEDLLFGLGSGCEGAMDILLQRLDGTDNWQPMTRLASAWQSRRADGLLLVVRSENEDLPVGSGVFFGDAEPFGRANPAGAAALAALAADRGTDGSSRFVPRALPGVDLLELIEAAAPRVLLLGAGPDALPVAELAVFMGWSLTVIDHRAHYAQRERFPGAERVLEGGAAALSTLLRNERSASERFAAAIVMSHHFMSDRNYLAALAASDIPYIGLLGPAVRCDRLLSQSAATAAALGARLHSPVGLDLGGANPEGIALAIVAEIQATLSGRQHVGSLNASRAAAAPSMALHDASA